MNGLSGNQNGKSTLSLAASRNLATLIQPASGEAFEDRAQATPPGKIKGTALPHAVREGDLPRVKELLAGGADPNTKDGDGWTTLMFATVKGHMEVARALLGAGADVRAKNAKGWTALRFAVSMDDTEAIRLLLEGGADVNDIDNEGDTALMQAAREKSIESLKLLLAHGADTGIRNYSGETALKIAARHGHPDIVHCLNEAGAVGEFGCNAETDEGELFSEGELEQLMRKIEGFAPLSAPVESSVDSSVDTSVDTSETQALAPTAAPTSSVLERLAAALEALRPVVQTAAVPASIADVAHKLTLSLPESAALSGLSRTHLRQAIRDGALKARKMGRGWRVKRADLETYVRKL